MSRLYSAEKRVAVWQKTAGHCAYCGADLHLQNEWVVDHIIPRSRGGRNDLANLIASCAYCNGSKWGRTVEEWRQWLLARSRRYYFDGVFHFERKGAGHGEASND
jgi:5-methylcytosine-specific restriction endonuclease McrA